MTTLPLVAGCTVSRSRMCAIYSHFLLIHCETTGRTGCEAYASTILPIPSSDHTGGRSHSLQDHRVSVNKYGMHTFGGEGAKPSKQLRAHEQQCWGRGQAGRRACSNSGAWPLRPSQLSPHLPQCLTLGNGKAPDQEQLTITEWQSTGHLQPAPNQPPCSWLQKAWPNDSLFGDL